MNTQLNRLNKSCLVDNRNVTCYSVGSWLIWSAFLFFRSLFGLTDWRQNSSLFPPYKMNVQPLLAELFPEQILKSEKLRLKNQVSMAL